MRKTIYTIAAIFLYSTTISAQNKLDKATYDKLVDYVNCKYTKAYIDEKIRTKDKGLAHDYITDYNARLNPNLEKIHSFENALSYDDLRQSARYKRAEILIDNINDKKKDDFADWAKEEIIKKLISLPSNPIDFESYLSIKTAELKTDLEKQLHEFDNTSKPNIAETGTTTPPVTDGKGNNSTDFWQWFVIIFILAIIVVSKLKKLLTRSKNDDKKLEKKLSTLEKRIITLENENKQIASQSNRNENDEKSESAKSSIIETSKQNNENVATDNFVLYADSIYNETFHKVTATSTEDTIFKLVKTPSGKTATFEVYKDAHEKILRRPDFLEGCEVQKIGSQSVETTEKGEAELEYNTWKITKKAKIKFI
ncbi:hypothetical protein AGMMS49982_04580 [Bacteroidia bacterium]|nr:hypothetical protein AGMMS49982_04580 [Bacteroidia bacterium]